MSSKFHQAPPCRLDRRGANAFVCAEHLGLKYPGNSEVLTEKAAAHHAVDSKKSVCSEASLVAPHAAASPPPQHPAPLKNVFRQSSLLTLHLAPTFRLSALYQLPFGSFSYELTRGHSPVVLFGSFPDLAVSLARAIDKSERKPYCP